MLPCPCGKEHGKDRVSVVFKECMPLRPFNWGAYDGYAPTNAIKDASGVTYECVFEKTGGDRDNEVQSAIPLIDSVEQPNWVTPLPGSHHYRVTISGLGQSTVLRAVVFGPSGNRSYGQVVLK